VDEQLQLDNVINHSAFPSFQILNHMNVISIPNKVKDFYDKECCICCNCYSMFTYIDDLDNNDLVQQYNVPLIMSCCNSDICQSCLKKHLLQRAIISLGKIVIYCDKLS